MRALTGILLCFGLAAQDRPKATLSDFGWLEGKWIAGMSEGRTAEETYSRAAGGSIVSMFRILAGEKTQVVELTSFTEGKDGIELRIRHFDTALTPFEKGDPIVLRLTSWDGKTAVFENFVHKKPKRSTLTRTSPDEMAVLVEIVNDDGSTRNIDLKMRREK